jgi:hypothetical protein
MQNLHHQSALVFTTPKRIGWAAAGSLGLGGLLLSFLIFSFIVLVNVPPKASNASMIALFGSVVMLPVSSIWYGLRLLRSPVRVTMDTALLTVHSLVSRRQFAWAQIASLVRDKVSGLAHVSPFTPSHKRGTLDVLILRDDHERELVRLTSAIAGFPVLAEEIETRSSRARGRPTHDPDSLALERARQLRRTARRGALIGGVMAAAALTVAIFLLPDFRAELNVKRTGQLVTAKVERRYMDRATPRLEYSFRDHAGLEHWRNVPMESAAWDGLEGARQIEVRYLVRNPERSHLTDGEIIDQPPLITLLAGAGSMAMLGLFLLALPILGIADVTIKDGRPRLVRLECTAPAATAPAPHG